MSQPVSGNCLLLCDSRHIFTCDTKSTPTTLQGIQADLKAVKTRVDDIGERLAALVERLISQRERESALSDVQCELENFKAHIMPAYEKLSGSVDNIEQLHYPGDATSTSRAGTVTHRWPLHDRHQFFSFLDASIGLTACSLVQCLLPSSGK